jgi:iron complex outermembrane receptor protein
MRGRFPHDRTWRAPVKGGHRRRLVARLHGVVATLACAPLACLGHARETAGSDATALDRLVVTAQKREADPQRVGIAITTLPGESLSRHGATRVDAVQYRVPSLEVEPAYGSQQAQFRLRGVGFVDYMSNNASPVGVFLDGVAFPFPVQTQGLMFDLARVEVLRGPQGVLYGRNTTAGAIHLVSVAPDAERRAGIEIERGTDDALGIQAHLAGAVTDVLRTRVALASAQGGAWQHERDRGEALGARDEHALRAQLDARLTPTFEVQLDLNLARDRSDAHGLYLFAPFAPASGAPPIPADSDRRATGWGLRPAFAARVGLDPRARPGRNNLARSLALTAIADFDGARLTSISALQQMQRREYGDYDATRFAESDQVFRDRIGTLSQELRLQSDADRALAWTVGLHAARDRLDERSYVDFADRLGGAVLTAYRQEAETLAGFGQIDWRWRPDWNLAIGLRHEREARRLRDFSTRFLDPEIVFVGPLQRRIEDSGLSGRIALEHRASGGSLAWASFARGFKSGGFTARNALDPAALDPFGPETLDAFELGIKASVDERLRLDAAVFHYDYRDQQVLSAYFEPLSQALIGVFVNAPRARIAGGELALQWRPTPELELAGFVGYKQGRYTAPFVTYDPSASLASGTNVFRDFDREPLDFPRWSAGARLAHETTLAHGSLRTELETAFRDRYPQQLLLGPDFSLDAYWRTHASLSYAPRGANWSVGLWARNLFDRRYDLTRSYFLPGTDVAAAAVPRSVGIRLVWRL